MIFMKNYSMLPRHLALAYIADIVLLLGILNVIYFPNVKKTSVKLYLIIQIKKKKN